MSAWNTDHPATCECGECRYAEALAKASAIRDQLRAAVQAPAPRDPAAGATPAREETALADEAVRNVVRQQIKNVGLVASNYRTLGATEWGEAEENAERLIMAALLAALRKRDAAREEPFKLTTLDGKHTLTLTREQFVRAMSNAITTLQAENAVLRAADEGRTPNTNSGDSPT